MKRFLILLAGLLLLMPHSAGAADEEARALVEELLTVSNTKQMLEQSFAQAKQMAVAQVQQRDIPEEDVEETQAITAGLMDIMEQEMSWESFKDDFVDIYLAVYTKEEIKGLLDFYKSPLGQKFLNKMPELLNKSFEIMQRRMPAIQAKVDAYMSQKMNELNNKETGQ